MLDINIFREEKGGDLEKIKDSQRKRGKDEEIVDKVVEMDKKWRDMKNKVETINYYRNRIGKMIAKKKKEEGREEREKEREMEMKEIWEYMEKKEDEKMEKLSKEELKKCNLKLKEYQKEIEKESNLYEKERDKYLVMIGNIVHESVPISDKEEDQEVIREWGEKKEKAKNHVDLMNIFGFLKTEKGTEVAGNRSYYMMGEIVRLNLALINYAMDYLETKGFTSVYPPYFMNHDIMSEVAQLDDFDEQLYKVTGDDPNKYLIATSEQPLCALHRQEWIDENKLPINYAGYSTCFRKEVGTHGKDTHGIFRVHQFEKIEQFVITSPFNNLSWDAHELLLSNSELFYQSLNLPYRVVNIVSSSLNNAAAKKYDLEGWFPASQTYRELVSCSNCTDYQSRRLQIRLRTNSDSSEKHHVHLLNSTLCATSRTLCCIFENYQTPTGIIIPPVLRPYLNNRSFLPFPL